MAYQAGTTLTAAMLNRLIASAQPSSNDTFTTSTKVLSADTATFTAISTHSYAVSWSTQHSSTVNSSNTVAARFVSGAGPIATGSTVLWQRIFQSTAGQDTFYSRRVVPAGVLSGLVTVGITALANSGATATVYGGSVDRELLIEDLGL